MKRALLFQHLQLNKLLPTPFGNNYEKPVSKENITTDNNVDFIQLICL
jgi:hypothetical protein